MQNSKTVDILDHAAYINNFMIKTFVETMINCTNNPNIVAVNNQLTSRTNPAIAMQFYYNYDTNRCYIELRLNRIFKKTYANQLIQIKSRFSKWIASNLKKETTVWPEVILPEDGKHENCDSSQLLTPFTIGYWKSLSGRYEFLEDKIKILKDYNDMAFPKYDDEYMIKAKEIYTQFYKGAFDIFTQKMYELNCEYDIRLDQKPKKDFRDFIETIEILNMMFHQVMLSEDDKYSYIQNYMNILATMKDNDDALRTAMKQLNADYGVKVALNEKIPEIFEIYKLEYQRFFEKELTTFELIHDESKFEEGEDDPIDHDDDNVEIWTYEGDFDFGEYVYHEDTHEITLDVDPDSVAQEDYDYNKACEPIPKTVVEIWSYVGDFDFGDLEEGVDPESVAVGDYEYNRAAEYIVLTTYYDIITKEG